MGIRSNVMVLVKGTMFGITPDRHTWMLELSDEPFVNGFRCTSNILPLLDFSGTIGDLIPKKDILCWPIRDQGERCLGNSPLALEAEFGKDKDKD